MFLVDKGMPTDALKLLITNGTPAGVEIGQEPLKPGGTAPPSTHSTHMRLTRKRR
jgi:hypothetical protein